MTVDEEKREQRLTGESTMFAYLELLRLPNVFTAMADVAMGFLFVQAAAWTMTATDGWVLGLLLVASSMLYASGVVLNDVFDLEHDTEHRPERPLPSGRVSLVAARWLGWQLLCIGVVLACMVGLLTGNVRPAVVAAVLAACIVLYNSGVKQTVAGPPLMGVCRMLNVLLGMSVAGAAATGAAAPWGIEHWLVAGGIGAYVAGITLFARREARQSNRVQLAAGTVVMLLGILLIARFPQYSDRIFKLLVQEPQRWTLLMVILSLLIGWRCVRAVITPEAVCVKAAVTHCIFSLVLLDATACYAIRGMPWAVMILLLLVPAIFFGRWIEST